MKKFIILTSLLFITACNDGYSTADFPVLPPELQDCSFYYLNNKKGSTITVVRCPNSTTTTTYKAGKSTKTTVVIAGN
jgi:hypothetical protein